MEWVSGGAKQRRRDAQQRVQSPHAPFKKYPNKDLLNRKCKQENTQRIHLLSKCVCPRTAPFFLHTHKTICVYCAPGFESASCASETKATRTNTRHTDTSKQNVPAHTHTHTHTHTSSWQARRPLPCARAQPPKMEDVYHKVLTSAFSAARAAVTSASKGEGQKNIQVVVDEAEKSVLRSMFQGEVDGDAAAAAKQASTQAAKDAAMYAVLAVEALGKQVTTLYDELEATKSARDAALQSTASLEQQLTSSSATVAALAARVEALETDLAAAEASRAAEHRAWVEEAAVATASRERAAADTDALLSSLRAELAHATRAVASTRSELAKAEKGRTAAEATVAQLKAALGATRDKSELALQEHKAALADLQSRCKKLTHAEHDASVARGTAEAAAAAAAASASAAEAAASELTERVGLLTSEVAAASSARDIALQSFASLEQQLAASTAKVTILDARIEVLETGVVAAEASEQAADAMLSGACAELAKMEAGRTEAIAKVEELTAALVHARAASSVLDVEQHPPRSAAVESRLWLQKMLEETTSNLQAAYFLVHRLQDQADASTILAAGSAATVLQLQSALQEKKPVRGANPRALSSPPRLRHVGAPGAPPTN